MSRRVLLGDAAPAALFLAMLLLEWGLHPIKGDGRGSSLAWGLLAVTPLLLRRSFPGPALAAGLVLVLGPGVVLHLFVPWFYGNEVTLYVLLYSFARRSGSLAARLGWLGGPVVFALQLRTDHDPADLLFDCAVLGLAWLAGRTVRRFDRQGSDLQETLTALAQAQQAREESAMAAERTRIAAEMHDVVAHAVSLMVVQVGATRIRLEKDGRPRVGLAEIEDVGRDALAELRRMLGVLREVQP